MNEAHAHGHTYGHTYGHTHGHTHGVNCERGVRWKEGSLFSSLAMHSLASLLDVPQVAGVHAAVSHARHIGAPTVVREHVRVTVGPLTPPRGTLQQPKAVQDCFMSLLLVLGDDDDAPLLVQRRQMGRMGGGDVGWDRVVEVVVVWEDIAGGGGYRSQGKGMGGEEAVVVL